MRAVCLQHVPFEGPGVFAACLQNRGAALERYLVPVEGLPKDAGDLLIIMGGPMSANDPDRWMIEEISFVKQALLAGHPVIGICLGSQIMARALGAGVRPGAALEIGMTPLTLTAEAKADRVLQSLPDRFEAFEWHGEVFDLPAGCVPLAGSSVAPLQAFRYRDRAYGLLFHVEIEPAGIEALCRECATDLTQAKRAADEVNTAAMPHLAPLHRLADRLVGHLLQCAD